MRLHYLIKGMSCAACVGHVERAIGRVVSETDTVTVSLLTNSVTILTSDDTDVAALENKLFKAVQAAGYTLILNEKKAEKEPSEFSARLRSLILSAIFTLFVMYLSMGSMIGLPIPPFLSGAEHGLQMALAQLLFTIPVLILNRRFFISGIRALLHRSPNMDSLVATGAGASVIYGIAAVLMIAMTEDMDVIHSWLHDLYFESAAMILTLVSLGKLLETRAKEKASDAVRSLATLSPSRVSVIRDGVECSVPTEELKVGDSVLIRAGEWIPIDGVVTEGTGSVDESAITGESMPVEKEIGDSVRAACILTNGFLKVRAEKVGEDTSLSRIIRLLEDAAASKAPIARIADRVSAVFVPCVMGISAITLLVWLFFAGSVETALRSAVAVLVISCPCALGLATPTAITVGIGRGASMGILFRSAEALEKLCGVKTVVFDKTGTLTEGNPALTDVIAYGEEVTHVLRLSAAVERLSSHPLSLAVQNGAERFGITSFPEVTEFTALTGVGASGCVENVVCRIGKPMASLFASEDLCPESPSTVLTEKKNGIRFAQAVDTSSLKRDFERLETEGKTVVLVTFDERPVGVLGIADRIRSDSASAVAALKNAGVTCLMLTGDNERTAAAVAKEAGLDGFYAGLLPEDKERMVRELSEQSPCAMVGDGINDAPALVRADVGIAIGAGTEIAVDCAGVVLSGSSVVGVADAYFLSRASIRIIKQNLFWALFYNAVCIPVAAGVFYPLLGWQLSPMLASAAMSFSSVCVVTNALRLRKISLGKGEKKKMFGKKEETVQTVLHIEGMMCQNCVKHVKTALEGVKGVKDVTVDLEKKTATVTAPSSVLRKSLEAAVTNAGYGIQSESDPE